MKRTCGWFFLSKLRLSSCHLLIISFAGRFLRAGGFKIQKCDQNLQKRVK